MFYVVLQNNFQVQAPRRGGGRLYLEGRLNGRFLALRAWGAYIWRGLFSEFYTVYFLSKKTPIKADNFVLLRFLFEDDTYWSGLLFLSRFGISVIMITYVTTVFPSDSWSACAVIVVIFVPGHTSWIVQTRGVEAGSLIYIKKGQTNNVIINWQSVSRLTR